jgi:hypothetical protein
MGITPTLAQYLDDENIDRDVVVDFGSGAFHLLLIRMEALQLEPDEVRRIESGVFGDLAEACLNCESKDRCECDLAYASAGTVTHDWENYCPNAATLNAMRALPWFGKAGKSHDSELGAESCTADIFEG